ncbi:MAG TPA: NAD(P)/FAD-dependent oxidoreductase [Thermoanaerobaculia bacterium]|jgi:monoamine oxidase|nr:NAD(P)/FAD-dependent oxidoreductase [Thermoanaerobaculia bacterium]
MRYDVLVIGAGAAGLAAARELSGAGKRVCLVEARGRVGGRAHTLHLPALPLPVELGAEFIHGEAAETFRIVEAAALLVYELPDDHWWSRNGELRPIRNFWAQIDAIRSRIKPRRDVSFAAFLRSRRNLTPRQRELVTNFVEGYHAAHADRISALALQSADGEQEEHKQFRLARGYTGLFDWLRAGLDPERVDLRMGEVIREIRWKDGDITAVSTRETIRAKAAVITIPIGVWKAPRDQEGAICFQPALPEKEAALAKLEVGHVVKIVYQFRKRFWEDDRNFIHSSSRFVPTWWTAAPARAPILTAWAGGHAADAMLAESAAARVERGLEAMAETFAQKRKTIDWLLVGAHTHDWQADPFSRGAYSYAGVGGSGAHDALARPVRNTLFFAGEATSSDQTGTVAGAIASGKRAARSLLRS